MIKFIKTKAPSNRFDTTDVTVETEAESLTQLLEDFKDFLAGCGYAIKPTDQIILTKQEEE